MIQHILTAWSGPGSLSYHITGVWHSLRKLGKEKGWLERKNRTSKGKGKVKTHQFLVYFFLWVQAWIWPRPGYLAVNNPESIIVHTSHFKWDILGRAAEVIASQNFSWANTDSPGWALCSKEQRNHRGKTSIWVTLTSYTCTSYVFEMGEVFCDVGPSATLFQEQSLSL